jgi:hypothetical protein
VFTIGRGNEVEVAAIRALEAHVVGRDAEELLADLGGFWKELVYDSQLRWLGPEKGVMHMAIGAVINALWDLRAKREGLPLWQVLGRLSPEEVVDLVDFRYLSDALTREEALDILRAAAPGRAQREADLIREGYPAYTTTPGWLGYSDEKLERLCREAVAEGFTQIKLKVGGNREDDVRRLAIARRAVGANIRIAVDANQRWDRDEAIDWIADNPYKGKTETIAHNLGPTTANSFAVVLDHACGFQQTRHHPGLGAGDRTRFHDLDLVAFLVLVGFVVRMVLLRAHHVLAVQRMLDAVFDQDRHGLVHLAADNAADEGALQGRCGFSHFWLPFSPITVRTRAMSRRTFFSWLEFCSCWVAFCMRRPNWAFSSSESSWFSPAASLPRSSVAFMVCIPYVPT